MDSHELKTCTLAVFSAETYKDIEKLAQEWLNKNPITHPLGDYVKSVFVAAYKMGNN
jgi:hypothetical protein